MFKQVMAVLLATVAFAPVAQAQEVDGQNGRDARMSRRGDAQRMREGGGDNGQRAQAPRAPEAQRAERRSDQPRPAPQAQVQPRNDVYRGGEARGTMFAQRAQRQQADAQVQAQVQVQSPRDGDRGRVGRQDYRQQGDRPQGNWQRGDAGRTAPLAVDQRRSDDQRRTDDARRADAARRNDGNRFGGQPRWDTNGGRNDANRTWGNDRRSQNNNWSNNNWSNNNWSNGNRNGRTDWSRGWRDDNRYDWGRYRQQNRNLFRLPRYAAPYDWNYGYRRFSIGVTLSSLLWAQDYWIDDPAYYRLPPAYGPYRWVRYYNDALLVDLRSGSVVDTVYDIFY